MSARPFTLACALLALAAGCGEVPDIDLRDRTGGFDTSPGGTPLASRPEPDARGVITYEDYQVAVARQGDTPRAIAQRLGLDAGAVARTNGIDPDAGLREGEVLTLPTRVPGALATRPLDVAAVATTALDRADGGAAPSAVPVTTATQPIRHTVQRGETAFSIARLYNIPVGTLASWNGLTGNLTVREGQTVLIPSGAAPADPAGGPLTAPGLGSPTPVPPSATAPLPREDTSTNVPAVSLPDAPDLTTPPPPPPTPEPPQISPPSPPIAEPEPASEPEPARSDARFLRPVSGAVIRDFNPGRNEGIDIGAAAGASVQAADRGTVAAVTEDTSGVAIVVLKHDDNLLTVYTNLENLSVAKGDSVSRGGRLGTVAAGSPTFLHFEVRRGMTAVDPNDFLP